MNPRAAMTPLDSARHDRGTERDGVSQLSEGLEPMHISNDNAAGECRVGDLCPMSLG